MGKHVIRLWQRNICVNERLREREKVDRHWKFKAQVDQLQLPFEVHLRNNNPQATFKKISMLHYSSSRVDMQGYSCCSNTLRRSSNCPGGIGKDRWDASSARLGSILSIFETFAFCIPLICFCCTPLPHSLLSSRTQLITYSKKMLL